MAYKVDLKNGPPYMIRTPDGPLDKRNIQIEQIRSNQSDHCYNYRLKEYRIFLTQAQYDFISRSCPESSCQGLQEKIMVLAGGYIQAAYLAPDHSVENPPEELLARWRANQCWEEVLSMPRLDDQAPMPPCLQESPHSKPLEPLYKYYEPLPE